MEEKEGTKYSFEGKNSFEDLKVFVKICAYGGALAIASFLTLARLSALWV